MFAIAAAVVFVLGLLLDLADGRIAGVGGPAFLVLALLLLALHKADVGTPGEWGQAWRRRH
ncbi:hypothetical protein ACFYSC_27310 [Streptosporangium sp. NPDC004379]|uniref:hypothetical protein n=1 Tax=Streptosporangium sp. NPDC004379 TaxID=3366189 RepID=UPI00369BE1B6